jgi:hypothetical protein
MLTADCFVSGRREQALSCSQLIIESSICHCEGAFFATEAIAITICSSPGFRDSFSFAHRPCGLQGSHIHALFPGQFLFPYTD